MPPAPPRSSSRRAATSGARPLTAAIRGRLTRDGGYSSPSQDDRGRVYAVQRGRFVRLSRGGRRIGAPFNAAVGRSGNVTAYGPWEAQVSPDGKPDRLLARHPAARCAGGRADALRPRGPGGRLAQRPLHARHDLRLPARLPRPLLDRQPRAARLQLRPRTSSRRPSSRPSPPATPASASGSATPTSRRSATASSRATAALLVVGAGGGLDLNNIALYRLSANTPPEAPERVCTYHSAGRLHRLR